MTFYARNVGADLLPFAPSYPGARRRAIIQAQKNAEQRKIRENPELTSPPFDAERLRRDLASLPSDTPTRRALFERGWTDDDVLARAQVDLRRQLARKVAGPERQGVASPLTAGAVMATHAAPVVALTPQDRAGALRNVALAKAHGDDPDREWPGWRERLGGAS
jgi:hypothetical protein